MTGPTGAPPAAGRRALSLGLAASFVLHGGLIAALLAVHRPVDRRAEPVDVQIVETAPPPPAPPPAAPEPPAPAPTRRAPPRLAKAPAPREAPPPSPSAGPPPPSNSAPAAPGPRQPPVRYGVSMSSTTTAGGFAAPVGNSAYGAPPTTAPDPASVQPYRGPEKYTPLAQVSTPPSCECKDIPKSEYPLEARKAEREGEVKLRLLVDASGRVKEATVVSEPGYGLGAAGRRAVMGPWCRCRPATRDGSPVATEFLYRLTFLLD